MCVFIVSYQIFYVQDIVGGDQTVVGFGRLGWLGVLVSSVPVSSD